MIKNKTSQSKEGTEEGKAQCLRLNQEMQDLGVVQW